MTQRGGGVQDLSYNDTNFLKNSLEVSNKPGFSQDTDSGMQNGGLLLGNLLYLLPVRIMIIGQAVYSVTVEGCWRTDLDHVWNTH